MKKKKQVRLGVKLTMPKQLANDFGPSKSLSFPPPRFVDGRL